MAVLPDFPDFSLTVCIDGRDAKEPKSSDKSQHNGREVYREMEYEIGSHCCIAIDLTSQLPFKDGENILNIEILIGDKMIENSYFKDDLQDHCSIYDEIEVSDTLIEYLLFDDIIQITVNVSLGILSKTTKPDPKETESESPRIAEKETAQEEQNVSCEIRDRTETGTGDSDTKSVEWEVTRQIGAFHFKIIEISQDSCLLGSYVHNTSVLIKPL